MNRPGRPSAVLALTGAMVLVACSNSDPSPTTTEKAPRPAERAVVTVANRTIVSTVKLDGTAGPWPARSVVTIAAGTIDLRTVDGAVRSVTPASVVASVDEVCPEAEPASETASADPSALSAAPTTTTACRPRRFDVTSPVAGGFRWGERVARALARGDRMLAVEEGEELGQVIPPGYRLALPLEDQQPAQFAAKPPKGYALLPGIDAPVFQVSYVGIEGEGDAVQVIASAIDPPPMVTGSKVTVSFIISNQQDVPALPASAVRAEGTSGRVLLLDSRGRTRVEEVVVGPTDGGYIEVQGLDPDDEVVEFPLGSELGGS